MIISRASTYLHYADPSFPPQSSRIPQFSDVCMYRIDYNPQTRALLETEQFEYYGRYKRNRDGHNLQEAPSGPAPDMFRPEL